MSDTFQKITEAVETLDRLTEEPSQISNTIRSYVEGQKWVAITYLKNATIRSWAIHNIIEGELAERRYGLTKQKATSWFGPRAMRWKDMFVFRVSYIMPEYEGDSSSLMGRGVLPTFYKTKDCGDQIAVKETSIAQRYSTMYSTDELVDQVKRTSDTVLLAFGQRLRTNALIQEEIAKYIAEEAWESSGSGNDFSGLFLNIQKLKAGHNEVISGLPPAYTEPPPDYIESHFIEKQRQ